MILYIYFFKVIQFVSSLQKKSPSTLPVLCHVLGFGTGNTKILNRKFGVKEHEVSHPSSFHGSSYTETFVEITVSQGSNILVFSLFRFPFSCWCLLIFYILSKFSFLFFSSPFPLHIFFSSHSAIVVFVSWHLLILFFFWEVELASRPSNARMAVA